MHRFAPGSYADVNDHLDHGETLRLVDASLRGSCMGLLRKTGAAKRSDGYCAAMESGARVAVRWSTSPVTDGVDSSHCSIDEAW